MSGQLQTPLWQMIPLRLFRNIKGKYHVELFLNYFNDQHRNITFTVEMKNDNQIPCLDVLVKKCSASDNRFSCAISVYRKPTYSGLGTSYFSYSLLLYNMNAININYFVLASTFLLIWLSLGKWPVCLNSLRLMNTGNTWSNWNLYTCSI